MLLSIRLKVEDAILLVMSILPFQFLIKHIFIILEGSDKIISLWKETIIIVSFFKILKLQIFNHYLFSKKFPFILFSLIIFVELFMLIFAPEKNDALVSFKVYCFPLITAYCTSNMKMSESFLNKLLKNLIFSSFFVFLISHLQLYFFSNQFALLMGIADYIASSGEIVFKYTASVIMGHQRMYGPFAGPNELGLYTSLIICFFSFVLFKYKLSKVNKIFITFILLIALATLIQTFSRISWLFTGLFFFISFRKITFKKEVLFSLLMLFSILLFLYFTTDFGNIFLSSIKFEEASAEGRPDSFFDGLKMIINHPMGLGIGTVQYSATKQLWQTEIFWWLVLVENGVFIGLLIFYSYLITFINLNIKKSLFAQFAKNSLIITIVVGFLSVIVFEPTFITFLWIFVGLGFNKLKIIYE
ncbi:MAG: hypothetical protein EO766_08035 [Hydrotalea sp. AMD]|uniref:O-antigen ligase family protein n=1 Tax=Hydrotalea sp. AMD TaxID=2501297 RepID=UPI0010262935|nr:hypothetical protein [Hydrotalea sp. AMD]RWZ88330.1 MAG: hypothetical protein EO766_08035 [Hydrotalea sp. AMD]